MSNETDLDVTHVGGDSASPGVVARELDSSFAKSQLGGEYHPFFHLLAWWLVVVVFAFGLYVAWDLGQLEIIYQRDRSYLTLVISLLVICSTIHAFWQITQKSIWLNRLRIERRAPLFRHDATNRDEVLEFVADRLRAPVEIGWFLVDLAIRLGLAGTIIGFILIFASLSGETIVGENALRELLVSMSGGMGTALFTTLTGLVAATVLSFQYLILGRLTEQVLGELLLDNSVHTGAS